MMRQRLDGPKDKSNSNIPHHSTKKQPLPQAPPTIVVFFFLLISRLLSAAFNNISDCDETFNYWEPLHRLQHAHGLQTWEYSPSHAIRSYSYLASMLLPLKLIHAFLTHDKIIQFFLLRGLLAVLSALVETYFLRSLRQRHEGQVISHLFLLLLFSPALYVSSTAFLPSSFSMLLCTLAYASWWSRGCVFVPVLFIACASLYGWPFASLIGVPIVVEMLGEGKKLWSIFSAALLSLFILLPPLTLFDSYSYGTATIPPLNILIYNVFSQHGPELYGTEPWSYYFLNCFLNFNIAFPLALLAFFLFVFLELTQKRLNQIIVHRIFSALMVLLLWMVVFFTRPHKEERFIFPIYPFICLCAAWSWQRLEKSVSTLFSKLNLSSTLIPLASTFLSFVFILLSLSRIFALYYGYHGAMKVYTAFPAALNHTSSPPLLPVHVCVGKEWYRFPSHFFLPQGYHLKFLRSEFRGQLPAEFSSASNATMLQPPHINDRNLEQAERYVDLGSCDFVVDLDTDHSTLLEPPYSRDHSVWNILLSEPFLDASRSSSLYRAFYIPFISAKHTTYAQYNVLQRRRDE